MLFCNDEPSQKAIILIRFVFLFLSLACSYSFAETNYRKELENFAQSLVFDTYHSLYELQESDKLKLKVAELDKRINYTPCQTPLQGEIVNNKIKKNTSVKVTCLDDQKWNVYIRVRVSVLSKAVVANSSLSKGQVLTHSNIALIYLNKSQIRNGSFNDLSSLYGSRLKRNISANRIIKNNDICVVCKGDSVSIYATQIGLSIRASGIALGNANIGETIRVKNSRTQRIVVGTVSALKEVKVSF